MKSWQQFIYKMMIKHNICTWMACHYLTHHLTPKVSQIWPLTPHLDGLMVSGGCSSTVCIEEGALSYTVHSWNLVWAHDCDYIIPRVMQRAGLVYHRSLNNAVNPNRCHFIFLLMWTLWYPDTAQCWVGGSVEEQWCWESYKRHSWRPNTHPAALAL